MNRRRIFIAASMVCALAGCHKAAPQALGTLEFDRISLPAPAAERVMAIHVREGDTVKPGQPLLELDQAHTRAELAAAEAQATQQQATLLELRVGPRPLPGTSCTASSMGKARTFRGSATSTPMLSAS